MNLRHRPRTPTYYPIACPRCRQPVAVTDRLRLLQSVHSPYIVRAAHARCVTRRTPLRLTARGRHVRDAILAGSAACTALGLANVLRYLW